MLSFNTGRFFSPAAVISEHQVSTEVILKREMDRATLPQRNSTSVRALIQQAWEKIKHFFSPGKEAEETWSELAMAKISYNATKDASEKLAYQVDAMDYFMRLKNMAGPAKQENFVCIHDRNTDMVTMKIYPDEVDGNSFDIDEDSPYGNSAAPIFEFTFNANELNTTNADMQQTWNGVKHSFGAGNLAAAAKIFSGMWEAGRSLNQDIDSIADLAVLADPTMRDQFQIIVRPDSNENSGKVKVELILGQFHRSETCDACAVAGSLMGYKDADPERIADETSPGEKALLAKLLVTVNSSRAVDIEGRQKELASKHLPEFYREYRPDDTHSEPVELRRDDYPVVGGHFDGNFRRTTFSLRQAGENAITVFTNIGYKKNEDGTVEFSMMHPVLRMIAQCPLSRLQSIADKSNPQDPSLPEAAINSAFFDLLYADYQLFYQHIDITQPALAQIYHDHGDTLYIGISGLSRNHLPIVPQNND